MAAREFHCTIKNAGTGPIEWITDHLDHGDWGGRLPSRETRSIQPGQTASYDAESGGGSIPIIGNIATGTEGWTLYKTTTASGSTEYIKIEHNVPYFQVNAGEARATVRAYRYDPRKEPGEGEFDDRDKTPPETRITPDFYTGGGPDQGPAFWQDAPYVLAFFFPALVGVPFSYRPVLSIGFTVSGNAVAPDLKFPQTKPEAFNPTFIVARNTSPVSWAGAWEGERMQVWISPQDDDLLLVEMRDKQSGHSLKEKVHIDRLLVGPKKPLSPGLKDIKDKMANVAVRKQRFGMGGGETVQLLTEKEKDVVKLHPDILTMEIAGHLEQRPLGGDFLAFSDGSCLEIFRMKQGKADLGYSLRYTSANKGGVPVPAAGAFQDRLYIMARIG